IARISRCRLANMSKLQKPPFRAASCSSSGSNFPKLVSTKVCRFHSAGPPQPSSGASPNVQLLDTKELSSSARELPKTLRRGAGVWPYQGRTTAARERTLSPVGGPGKIGEIRIMRFQFAVPLATILSIAATAQTPSTEAAPNVKVVEEIAAKVNFEIVTRGQLEDRYKEIEAQAPATGLHGTQLADFIKDQKANALRDEIDQMLLVQKGKEMPGLNVDADVTKFFNAMQSQARIPDEEKFHAMLLQQYGETYEELRERKKRDIISQKVVG